MIYHEGFYYYSESRNQNSIHIRKSREITKMGSDAGIEVWTPPAEGDNSKAIWAPELHFIKDRWYIYYAADDGLNENHRMWVLESETADPQGAYRCRGRIVADQWAIDGTVLETDDGSLYFIWSGWPGEVNGRQNLYIARMKDPVTLAGPRVLLSEPENDWECVDMPICEGPQILKRNGKIFLVYSASGSWTVDYCLGMLVFKGGDVLDPNCWQKVGPVFQKSHEVWGVGHCSFVQSHDRTEDWIVYHAKSRQKKGWTDRHIHAQPFTWTNDGLPHFGTPLSGSSNTSAPVREARHRGIPALS